MKNLIEKGNVDIKVTAYKIYRINKMFLIKLIVSETNRCKMCWNFSSFTNILFDDGQMKNIYRIMKLKIRSQFDKKSPTRSIMLLWLLTERVLWVEPFKDIFFKLRHHKALIEQKNRIKLYNLIDNSCRVCSRMFSVITTFPSTIQRSPFKESGFLIKLTTHNRFRV